MLRSWQGVVPARVVAHDDPKKMGRLRVQFFWQGEGAGHWARWVSPHAGPERGMMFLPEVGDEVAVVFEDGDPERPVVLGAMWNGVHAAPRGEFFGGDIAPNNVKRIVTKSGNRLQMIDTPGRETVVVATPNHAAVSMTERAEATGRPMMVVHSDGDIVLAAPEGRVHVQSKFFSAEVGDASTVSAAAPVVAAVAASPLLPPMSCKEKMEMAASRAPLGKGVLDALGGAKGIAAGIAVMVGLQFVPVVGEVEDLVAALVVVGLAISGAQIADGIKELYHFRQMCCGQAKTEADIQQAGNLFADAVGKIGVNTLMAVLGVRGLKGLKGGRVPVEEPASGFKMPNAGALEGLELNGVKPVRIRPGTNGKVAVIGRSMAEKVNPYAEGLKGQGYDVETFNGEQIPDSASEQWEQLKKDYFPNQIPDDVVTQSELYQANQAWADKLASEGYTVVDTGTPPLASSSPFYNMEQDGLFGRRN